MGRSFYTQAQISCNAEINRLVTLGNCEMSKLIGFIYINNIIKWLANVTEIDVNICE